jgi:hypothetical protein
MCNAGDNIKAMLLIIISITMSAIILCIIAMITIIISLDCCCVCFQSI